jgi:hypothetical protein
MSNSHRSATFIIVTITAIGALLSGIATFNARIDPFQQYRLADPGMARYPRGLQRYINPGLAKNADYDFVITGSSLMENYTLSEVNRACKAKSINLSFSAMSAFEQRKILEVALRHHAPRRVMMSLDYNSFAPPIDQSLPEITDPLPLYLYDENPFNDFRYLLSGTVTMRAWVVFKDIHKRNESTDFNRAWNWEHEAIFSREHALKNIDPDNINRRFKQGQRTLARMKKSFDVNIYSLVEANPGTEFNLIFPPYSIVVWADFVQRGQLGLSLDFKKYVVQRLEMFPNVRIFDMQWDENITHNLNLYTDIYHFSPAINRLMLDSVCGTDKRYRANSETISGFISRLREQSMGIDPAEFVRESPN